MRSRLSGGPSGRGFEGQDLEPFRRSEVRAIGRRNPLESGTQESTLALGDGELCAGQCELASEADAMQRTVLGPGADERHAAMGRQVRWHKAIRAGHCRTSRGGFFHLFI